jgi:hypothetical protein
MEELSQYTIIIDSLISGWIKMFSKEESNEKRE